MAYLNMLLPQCIDLTWVGGSGFSTQIVVMANATESRNQDWQYDRSKYRVSYNARNAAAWQQLMSFFRLACGRANTWRLKDPADNICLAADGKFIVIDSTHVQMVKRYSFAGALTDDSPNVLPTVDSIITKPDPSVTLIGAGTFDPDTGIVTHSGTPPTAWAGLFYRHCRFDVDQIQIEGIDKSLRTGTLIAGWRDVPIVEVRGE